MQNDTRAVARLPSLELEIRHRAAAEYLAVRLRATPGLDAVAAWMDPFAVMRAWASLNPWLAVWSRALPANRERPPMIQRR